MNPIVNTQTRLHSVGCGWRTVVDSSRNRLLLEEAEPRACGPHYIKRLSVETPF